MAKKGSFSKVYDKNGDYVDVEAARFDGTRTFQMQGDVSATQTWNGDSASALTLNTSIGAKKVTTDKINDKAVQTGQIDDGAVGLTQIATNAMNGTVQDNDSKLATHAAVKTYVDSQISGQGTYLGKHTVAEINAMVTDNLHNGDRVMTSDSGTINLGPGGVGFDVEAGEDLILYKSGSTVQWDSMDGNFKTKQSAVSDPTASGTGLTFIDSASQDENGEMTLSKKTVQDGTTSQKGVVQLEDSHSSTSTTKAATPKNVKEAYDLASTANSGLANKQDKPSSATENNIATFNGSKSTKDSGKAFLPSTSTWDGTSDDKVPTAKAVQAQLDGKADASKVVVLEDGITLRGNVSGGTWYKIASQKSTATWAESMRGTWDVTYTTTTGQRIGTLQFVGRWNTSGEIGVYIKTITAPASLPDLKVVTIGTVGDITVELWVSLTGNYTSFGIRELSSGTYSLNKTKDWTYYDNSGAGTSEPTDDASTHKKQYDVDKILLQRDITSPTNNNLVAMDADGLVKDSGIGSGTLNTALTKLNGIAEGAEANVQADWNETSSSSDAFIKNKPYFTKYSGSSAVKFKVCTVPKFTAGSSSCGGIEVLYRVGDGAIHGELLYKVTYELYLKRIGDISLNDNTVKFYYVENPNNSSYIDIYADSNKYCTLTAAPLANAPKDRVDFTEFGTVVTSIPEGASEVAKVCVANSSASSGTAPVKVDAYGTLTPVPMDSTPTASSTNLMTSGDIKTALDGKQDSFPEVQTTWVQATIGTDTKYYRKIGSVTLGAWSRATAIFVCSFDDGRPGGILEIALRRESNSAGEPTHASVSLFTTTQHGGNIDATKYNIGYEMVDGTCNLYFKATSTQGQVCRCIYSRNFTIATASVSTAPSAYTNIPIYTAAQSQFEQATGSSSVPIYVDKNGVLTACTDDFVHDSDLSAYEQVANKVSAWQSTPDNTHYPSEKLVKDGLDAKADADNAVTIYDSCVCRINTSGNYWYKIAEVPVNNGFQFRNAVWDVYANVNNSSGVYKGTLVMKTNSSASSVEFRYARLYTDDWDSNVFDFKIVVKTTFSNGYVQLWAKLNSNISSLSISERFMFAGTYKPSKKSPFTYTSYDSVAGEVEPQTDATNNITANPVNIVYRQHAIASPTNDNLVAMDADGLVKDSGLTKSSVESAISSAGSAIQGVKVNNTTLTPDANKVVTVPLATTSADGAMSAADKTKLNNAVTKKTGFAYKGTAGGDVFKIAEKAYSKTFSHSEQFVFHVAYGRHSTNAATSELNVLLVINKDSASSVTVFKNTILSKQGFSSLDWTFKASVDDTNGLFTLYAVRTAGQYTTVEATCIAANSEKNNLIDNVVVFENTTAELPETAFTETTLFSATSSSSSGTAPVKVDAYGALTPVPMDSTPTASSTNLMTSGDIKTALDNAVANNNKRYPFGVRQNRTTSYGYRLFNVKFSTAQSATRVRVSGNIVVGTTGDNERISFDLVIANVNTTENNPSAISLLTTSTRRGSRVVRLAYKRPSNWTDGLDVFILWNAEGTATATNDTYGWEITQQEATLSSGVEVKDENLTSALTGFTLDTPRTAAITEGTSAIGSTSVPVYANENGVITPCTDDFVHDAEIAKMVQVETAGTAAGSSLQPVYVDTNGVAKAGIYTSWESARGADNWINALSIGWYRSSGNFQTTQGTTPQYIRFFGLEQQGIVDFWVNQFGPNKPMVMHFTVDFTSSGPGTIVIKERTGYDRDNIESLVVYREKSGTSVRGLIIKIVNSQGYNFVWRSTGNITSSNCEKLTDTEYTTFIADYNIMSTAIPPDRGGFSSTARNKQRGNNILDTGDVKSTYSSTGTDPVNGTAVAAALATSLTDVEYVAAQSGGGGNLNKTKNGSTTSVLAFMTTAEAHSLWNNAKANAS